jgi:hypothetical protein
MFFAERVRNLNIAIVEAHIGEIGANMCPDGPIDHKIVLPSRLRDRNVASIPKILAHRADHV